MEEITYELLIRIASDSQFVWRPLTRVNHKFNTILTKYNMYDYINGVVFVSCNSDDELTFTIRDELKSIFEHGLCDPYELNCIQIIYQWERVREYNKARSVSHKKWIIEDSLTVHIHENFRGNPVINYRSADKIGTLVCRSIDRLGSNVTAYYQSFTHLLTLIPDLEHLRYIIGSKYIPDHL